jgi:hypothetical protein
LIRVRRGDHHPTLFDFAEIGEQQMKALIEVKDRKEGDAIRAGLEDPSVRAFVVVMGALKMLPTDRARRRVLQFVVDKLEEDNERNKETKTSSDADGGSPSAAL